ncbi:sugar nucleotide-binding protein [bacterium]|nr:sugar nucleotide-binding protein [bacterium]
MNTINKEENQNSNKFKYHLPNVLIVGVDSKIGSALKERLIKQNVTVYGTTRKLEKINKDTFYFNLENSDYREFKNLNYDTVVVCAGTTKISQCEEDPQKHRTINVTNTIKMVETLSKNGSFIIYLSSNTVFDGKKAFYKNTDKTCPTTMYGIFKSEVENYLTTKLSKNSCVLRLTKVMAKNDSLIEHWKNQASAGLKIKTYKNKFISPVNIYKVIDTIQLIIKQKSNGIFQLGGNEEITYTDFAKNYFQENQKFLKLITEEIETNVNNQVTYNSLLTYLPSLEYKGLNSHSFEGTDLILSSILRDVSNGTYIDLGANHPIKQNNTFYFYKLGWRGLAIDGNNIFEKDWKNIRPNDIFVRTLISNKNKVVNFNIYPDNTLSTMNVEAKKRNEFRYELEKIKTVEMETQTLQELKNKFLQNSEIHLLSIDIEGEDLNALIGAKLEFMKPGVITVETKNLSLYNVRTNEIVEYLTKHNYRLIAKTPLDAIFVYPFKKYLEWIPKSLTDLNI